MGWFLCFLKFADIIAWAVGAEHIDSILCIHEVWLHSVVAGKITYPFFLLVNPLLDPVGPAVTIPFQQRFLCLDSFCQWIVEGFSVNYFLGDFTRHIEDFFYKAAIFLEHGLVKFTLHHRSFIPDCLCSFCVGSSFMARSLESCSTIF